jgi:2-keto-4-pentenoate hydratase/2-oxohepta-3-ene-1,7-dioic acid hydratase in catechol pathway
MRLANKNGRAVLVTGNHSGIDVAAASHDRFGPGLPAIYDRWDEFRAWASRLDGAPEAEITFDETDLACPSPQPRQVFAIGLNYGSHADEAGFERPVGMPPVFTKFPSSLAGPHGTVELPAGGHTDWEVELVVIVGRETWRIDEAEAWGAVAGLSVGQDISERLSQLAGPAPQFSLGKSFPGFAPVGPWLVTPDEFDDPDDLELGCSIDGETVQLGRTKDLIFSVPALLAGLSRTMRLFPGDLVFTGTPEGVGHARNPQRFLKAGEELVTWIEGIGQIRQRFVDSPEAA